MSIVTKWDPEKLKRTISAQVVQNMERAVDFAAGEARARVPVKTGALKGAIATVVTAQGDDVIGYVGVLRKSKAWYARFVELGTARAAAHPFLRPAVFDNGKRILRILCGGK